MEDKIINLTINDQYLKLVSKPGVFSAGKIDQGTQLLLDNIELSDHQVVCDLGAGVGIIGIYLAKKYKKAHVHLLEDHLRSFQLAKKNIEINNCQNIEIFLSDLFSSVDNRTYQLIVSNPPQQLGNDFLEELVLESFKHLKPHGKLLLVLKSNLKEVAKRVITKVFGNLEVLENRKDFVIFRAMR